MPNLAKIYEHTCQISQKTQRKHPKARVVSYIGVIPDYVPPILYDKTEITVVNRDTILTALDLIEEKLNPLVLNMASDRNPGGGVAKGARAQEEDLFRRTNYCVHLNRYAVKYPLRPLQIVYTPNVAVIKNENYNLLENPEHLSFIACAGIRNHSGKPLSVENLDLLRNKIRVIFQTAVYYKHDSLVLGALGCGAFGCSPEEVAPIFNEISHEFQRTFKKIVYAVLSRNDRNFDVFNDKIYRD